MKETYQKQLLQLARETIKSRFSSSFKLETVPPEFQEKRGVFTTLHKQGKLRGCVGCLQPVKPLHEAIKENALNAAFHDPRFPPLKDEELAETEIEISILTVPQKLDYSSPAELVRKLRPKIDGVILKTKSHSATFLPQVWEEISDPFDFLERLTWKAGLPPHAWETAEIYVYQVERFKENQVEMF